MFKQICVLLSMLIGGISPLGIAILGYFVFFLGFDWSYLVIWIAVWIVSVSLGVFVAKKEKRFEFYYELLGNGFGWVWLGLVGINTNINLVFDIRLIYGWFMVEVFLFFSFRRSLQRMDTIVYASGERTNRK